MYFGVSPVTAVGVVPTPCTPPTALGPLPQPKPSCTPMSRAKLRVAATTRASISTSCVLRSICWMMRSICGRTAGMSETISELGAPVLGFLPQRFHGGDAQYIAVQLAGQIVVLEHDVQRLIPRHVIEHDCKAAMDHGIEHHVQTADLVNQAEEI